MKIAVGSDHGGFALKEAVKKHLESKGIEVEDFGCYSTESVDYAVTMRCTVQRSRTVWQTARLITAYLFAPRASVFPWPQTK